MTKHVIMEALKFLFQNTNRYIGNSVEQYKGKNHNQNIARNQIHANIFSLRNTDAQLFYELLKQLWGFYKSGV